MDLNYGMLEEASEFGRKNARLCGCCAEDVLVDCQFLLSFCSVGF